MTQACPLCAHPTTQPFHADPDRDYLHCPRCDLIFVEREALLGPAAEKARYDRHENDPTDPAYRHFLNQLVQPLLARLGPPPLKGLDFGSGPGPTLSIMLAEQGYPMRIYDPFYAPNPQVLDETYDFVTCTETLEHFYTPHIEWHELVNLVKPGGWLGIMTRIHPSPEDFPAWSYKNDDTHVSFYSQKTFTFLADQDDLHVDFIGDNVILFYKPVGWQPPRPTGQTTTPNR